jgi:hypothetical protein
MKRPRPGTPRGGFVPVPREFFASDPFWTEDRPRTRAEAWLDFLSMAAFIDHSRMTAHGLLTQRQGEVIISLRTLAKRWQWSVKQVRSWIGVCLRLGRIRAPLAAHTGAHFGTVYTIAGYPFTSEDPGDEGTPKGTEKGTDGAQTGHTEGTLGAQERKNHRKGSKKSKKGNVGETRLATAAGALERAASPAPPTSANGGIPEAAPSAPAAPSPRRASDAAMKRDMVQLAEQLGRRVPL